MTTPHGAKDPQTATTSDLASRVAALEGREEVRGAIAAYCAALDRGDVDEAMSWFLEDATLVNPAGTSEGMPAIEDYYRSVDRQTTFSRHHVTNQVITMDTPDSARHEAYFLALIGRDSESRIAFGRYSDALVRTGDGWKFRLKTNELVGVTSLAEGWPEGFAGGE